MNLLVVHTRPQTYEKMFTAKGMPILVIVNLIQQSLWKRRLLLALCSESDSHCSGWCSQVHGLQEFIDQMLLWQLKTGVARLFLKRLPHFLV